jgi:hypothetical protein
MNALRRILLAIYSVLLVAACAGLGLLAWNQDQQLDIDLEDFRLTAAIASGDTEKWTFTALLACVALFGILTFLLAVLRTRTDSRRGTLRLRQSEGGTVEVTADALETLLRDELERLPEIRRADPEVRLLKGVVNTDISAVIEPSASIAHVTNLIAVTTASTLREQVGVTNVRRPNVRILYDEANARPMASRPRPTAPVYSAPSGREEPWPEPPPDLHDRPAAEQPPAAEPWPEPPSDLQPTERPAEEPAANPEQQPEGADQARD